MKCRHFHLPGTAVHSVPGWCMADHRDVNTEMKTKYIKIMDIPVCNEKETLYVKSWIYQCIWWRGKIHYLKSLMIHIHGLMQERCNSSANALVLRLSCTNPSIWILWPVEMCCWWETCGQMNRWTCSTDEDNTLLSKRLMLTHCGWDKMDSISQTTFLNVFSWLKMFEFQLKTEVCC